MGSSTAMINVTNVSTFRFRVLSNSLVTDGKFVGDGTNPYTSVMFERKYPSQWGITDDKWTKSRQNT